MTTATPAPDAFLAREYERMRDDVLTGVRGRLAVRGLVLADADLDAVYNQSWHALYDRLSDGEEVHAVRLPRHGRVPARDRGGAAPAARPARGRR